MPVGGGHELYCATDSGTIARWDTAAVDIELQQLQPVADPAGMLNLIAALAPGQSAKVRLKRQGQDVDATVTVGRRPKPQARAE